MREKRRRKHQNYLFVQKFGNSQKFIMQVNDSDTVSSFMKHFFIASDTKKKNIYKYYIF